MRQTIEKQRESNKQQTLKFIRTPDDWPAWPVLPMRKYSKGEAAGRFPEVGFIWADDEAPCVRLGNLYELANQKQLNVIDVPTKSYSSFEEMLEDGWEVD